MYVKSKSTLSESVSESVTRSPIELFWTAKNGDSMSCDVSVVASACASDVLYMKQGKTIGTDCKERGEQSKD